MRRKVSTEADAASSTESLLAELHQCAVRIRVLHEQLRDAARRYDALARELNARRTAAA